MALRDYRACDMCGNKTFYDANLNYDDTERAPRIAGEDSSPWDVGLERLGDWAVLCRECVKTHQTQIVRVERGNLSAQEEGE